MRPLMNGTLGRKAVKEKFKTIPLSFADKAVRIVFVLMTSDGTSDEQTIPIAGNDVGASPFLSIAAGKNYRHIVTCSCA